MPCDAEFKVPDPSRALEGALPEGRSALGVPGLCSQIKIYYILCSSPASTPSIVGRNRECKQFFMHNSRPRKRQEKQRPAAVARSRSPCIHRLSTALSTACIVL